ncbi:hypothetical protein ACET3X_005619 [Alternaria dauci]|uniref:Uncharacterized protein n=1 Tax=Alternaria dauci TaxID=48095 RepID=A0ABR3UL88_9PLEO
MAKKTKRTKAANFALPRPVISPYTSPSVNVYFGPTKQIYYLPDSVLQRLGNIPSPDPWTGEIHLADVDANTGHVLIHFLLTGLYQTLKDENGDNSETTSNNIVCNEFRTAVLTLEAAKKYSVPGLQTLAQIELERLGNDMSLYDVVRAIREDSIAGPSDEHVWLRTYISLKVRSAFKHDRSAFSAPNFFESIESPTLTGLVAQDLVGLYSEEVEKLHEEKTSASKVSAPAHGELLGSHSGTLGDSVGAWQPQDQGHGSGSRLEDNAPLASPSPSKERTYVKERDDGQSWESYKDIVEVQQLQKEHATIAQSQERSVVAASSTVIQDKSDEIEVQSLSDDWDVSWVPKKKSKKNSMLKTDSAPPPAPLPDVQSEVGATPAITDVATLATVEPGAQKDPYAGLSKFRGKKLKAKLDRVTRMNEDEDVRREKEKEADEIRRQEEAEVARLKEEERLATENERLVREAGEEAERKKKEENANGWASLSATAPDKKKKKKGKKAERVLPQEDEGISKQIQCEDAAADINDVGSTDAVIHNDNCEWRLEHLLSDDGWQNCRSCELYMRKIAIKLHSAELPVEDGFTTID